MSRKHFKRLDRWKHEKKTGFDGYIYDFSTDYKVIATSDILDFTNF